jgi:hypothetical protein
MLCDPGCLILFEFNSESKLCFKVQNSNIWKSWSSINRLNNLNLIPVVVKMAQLTLLFVESGTTNSSLPLASQPKPTLG